MPSTILAWAKNLGRNGWDRPVEVGPASSVEARNVHLYKGGLGTRRGGSVPITITGTTPPFHGLFEYVATSLASAELWAVDDAGQIFRCAGGSSFTNETLKDALTGSAADVATTTTAVLNGKLYFAYRSGINRIHVYDPNNASTNTVRRGGLRPFSTAPTVSNTGSGTYAATLRYYRCRNIEQQSGVTTRRSEPSASVSFTPSGSGTAARVFAPTAIAENETHFEVEGSTDNITFYVVAGDAAGAISGPVAIGTGQYDDTSTPGNWATALTASAVSGTYTCFPSVKSLGTDGTHLYGFGVWETSAGDSVAPKAGRFFYSPALDTTTTNDDERISNTTTLQGFIDATRLAGTVDRGCAPKPVNNAIFCFQDRGVYAFYPTGSATTPFRRVVVHPMIGNLHQRAITVAVDHRGSPACYFTDPVLGPYTAGGNAGLAWCGKDVADIWALVNRDATTVPVIVEWHPDRNFLLWLLAINGSNLPNFGITLDPSKMQPDASGDLRGGWATWDGDFTKSSSLRAFSTTLSSTRASTRTLYSGGLSKLLRYDETVFQDDTTTFQAYVTSGAQQLDHQTITLERAYLLASANSVTIQQSLIRNTQDETPRTSSVTTTPLASETTVLKKFEDAALADAWCFQVQLGDASAQNANFGTLQQWRARTTTGADL
jgi:hypothetical protein